MVEAPNKSTRLQHISGITQGARLVIKDRGYEPGSCIGRGSYGMVFSAKVVGRSAEVAVKRMRLDGSCDNLVQIARELRILRLAGRHPDVASVCDAFVDEQRDFLYVVMPKYYTDLGKVISSTTVLTEKHVQYFMFQILHGLKFLHAHGIVHRDLKPQNILVNKNTEIFIADFGMARAVRPVEAAGGMSPHVVTRWYRAPELMLCPDGIYDASIDIWAAGCIMGDILGRRVMFPGSDFVNQLDLIFNIVGAPEPDEVKHVSNGQARAFLDRVSMRARVDFGDLFPEADSKIVSLCDALLIFDPPKRLTAAQALEHPALAMYCEAFPGRGQEVVYGGESFDVDSDFSRAHRIDLQAVLESDEYDDDLHAKLKECVTAEVDRIRRDDAMETSTLRTLYVEMGRKFAGILKEKGIHRCGSF